MIPSEKLKALSRYSIRVVNDGDGHYDQMQEQDVNGDFVMWDDVSALIKDLSNAKDCDQSPSQTSLTIPPPNLPATEDCHPRLVRVSRCSVDEGGEDYVIDLMRPDGSIVSILLPMEKLTRHPSKVVADNDPKKPFGLNLVSDSHYC